MPTKSETQYPSWKVFIYGLDVTKDVLSVALNNSDGKIPNTASITLQNNLDKYIITLTDMVNILNFTTTANSVLTSGVGIIKKNVSIKTPAGDFFSQGGDPDIASDRPISPQNFDVPDADKSRVISAKLQAPNPKIAAEVPAGQPPIAFANEQPAYRYPFQAGKPIFHPNDPVRIALRDQDNPNIWYWAFSGFMSDFTDTIGVNQDRTVTIVAESPAKLLRYARFTSNPGLVDIGKREVRAAINADASSRSVFANIFRDLTLPEIFFAMLFGSNTFDPQTPSSPTANGSLSSSAFVAAESDLSDDVYYANGKGSLKTWKWGIGHMRLQNKNTPESSWSSVYEFGEDEGPGNGGLKGTDPRRGIPPQLNFKSIKNLEDWQSAIDNTVKFEDMVNMLAPTAPPDTASHVGPDQSIEDVITFIGENPQFYPVDGGRLMMLIPKSLGASNRELVLKDLVNSFHLNTEWSTRAELLYDTVERIQFVFYVSPRGDFVVEFPLVDFKPSDFGKYADNYIVKNKNITTVESAFTDSKVMTQAVANHTFAKNWGFADTDLTLALGLFEVVTLWHLIPMHGVRQAPITPQGYVDTVDGAELYAHIQLNRLNADAYTQKIGSLPRFNAWVNRPYYIQLRNHIGTTKNFCHNISWGMGGDASSSVGLFSMRGWSGDLDSNNEMIFTPLGGWPSRPFGYDVLFNRGQVQRKLQQQQQKAANQSAAIDDAFKGS